MQVWPESEASLGYRDPVQENKVQTEKGKLDSLSLQTDSSSLKADPTGLELSYARGPWTQLGPVSVQQDILETVFRVSGDQYLCSRGGLPCPGQLRQGQLRQKHGCGQ